MVHRWQITGLVLFIALATSACTHRVGFHPLQPVAMVPTISKTVLVHVDPEVLEASYVYKTPPYKWVIPYGPRLKEFVEIYFGAAFADFRLIAPSAVGSSDHVVVDLHDIEYRFVAQHAYAEISATATWQGEEVLARTYSYEGWSGTGAVMGGGVFAQKGVARSSTDDAFSKVFEKMIRDLQASLGGFATGQRGEGL